MGKAPKLALRILPVFAAALVLTIAFPGRFRFTGRLWGVAVAAINRLAAPDYFIDGRGRSTRIHPELQDLAVGDPAHPDAKSNSSWASMIQPLEDRACRLIIRFRSAFPGNFASVVGWGIVNRLGSAMLQQPAPREAHRSQQASTGA